MTTKKPRRIEPYTQNMDASMLGAFFKDPLDKDFLFREHFKDQKPSWPEISNRIYHAISSYYLELRTNPDRKETQRQRSDQFEMIESMKEVFKRLQPWHIPLPLLDKARAAYKPRKGAKANFRDEIRNVLLRLDHLRMLFESIEIHTPTKTNPGKPERDRLIEALVKIFDDFKKNEISFQESPANDVAIERKTFVEDVCNAFRLEMILPRTI